MGGEGAAEKQGGGRGEKGVGSGVKAYLIAMVSHFMCYMHALFQCLVFV